MGDWIAKIFDITKLPTKFVALAALVSSFLLFAPARALIALRLREWSGAHGGQVGLVWVVSIGLICLNVALWLLKTVRDRWRRLRLSARLESEIEHLDPSEIAVLREFMLQRKDTITLPIDESTVAGLFRKGFLERVGGLGQHSLSGVLWPVRLVREVRQRLHPAVLGLPMEQPNEAEIARIRGERPVYIRDILQREEDRGGFHW